MILIKKRELAAELSVSTRTLNNFMKSGVVPFFRVGNVVRFDRAAVEEALKAFRVEPRKKGVK
jgi:excisionase family DNA binding protein